MGVLGLLYYFAQYQGWCILTIFEKKCLPRIACAQDIWKEIMMEKRKGTTLRLACHDETKKTKNTKTQNSHTKQKAKGKEVKTTVKKHRLFVKRRKLIEEENRKLSHLNQLTDDSCEDESDDDACTVLQPKNNEILVIVPKRSMEFLDFLEEGRRILDSSCNTVL